MTKWILVLGVISTRDSWGQTPPAAGCVATPATLDTNARVNQDKMLAIDLNSAKLQKDRLVMRQLLASLSSDAKFQSEKAKMQQHIQSLATDAKFQNQKKTTDDARRKIETSPERDKQLAKFTADAAKGCPSAVH